MFYHCEENFHQKQNVVRLVLIRKRLYNRNRKAVETPKCLNCFHDNEGANIQNQQKNNYGSSIFIYNYKIQNMRTYLEQNVSTTVVL